MTKNALILVLIAFLLAVVVGAYVFLSSSPANETPDNTSTNNPFNFSTGSTVIQQEDSLELVTTGGEKVYIPDFTKTNQPAWASEETGYNVAGTGAGAYAITYYPGDTAQTDEFVVSLLAEPLGENRRAAEQALLQLGLTTEDICTLNVQVLTSIHVNEQYAGYDLGISFCPNATVLP